MAIWVDAWQMQCCGEQFGVGSCVSWTLADADGEWLGQVLGADIAVDAAEEHHGGVPDDTPRTAGTVTAVSAVHCRYAPRAGEDQRILHPVPSSAVLTPLTSADGWTPDRDGLRFTGYLVRIATQLRPAGLMRAIVDRGEHRTLRFTRLAATSANDRATGSTRLGSMPAAFSRNG